VTFLVVCFFLGAGRHEGEREGDEGGSEVKSDSGELGAGSSIAEGRSEVRSDSGEL